MAKIHDGYYVYKEQYSGWNIYIEKQYEWNPPEWAVYPEDSNDIGEVICKKKSQCIEAMADMVEDVYAAMDNMTKEELKDWLKQSDRNEFDKKLGWAVFRKMKDDDVFVFDFKLVFK